MSIDQEIDKAITAHTLWKAQLRLAVDSRRLDTPVATLQLDDQCAFGRWLHGSALTPEQKVSGEYEEVLRLHSQFHETAARVAALALAGEKTDAERMISTRGEFSSVSTRLTTAMMAWKKRALA